MLILLLLFGSAFSQSVRKVHLGFPEAWDGDKYKELYCPSKNIPKFLDGYFLCQLSASYGSQRAPAGRKLNHMIDAIGAVGAFHISNGQVVFSAQYYPARPYKIWEFYDRNMTKASVPWAGWSDYNLTAMGKWEQVPANQDSARFHPNLDFWRVGNKIIAGTEAPYWVGYEFDVKTLDKFKLFPFVEENDVFGNPKPSMIPISMAIHERRDSDGTIWGSFSAMNFNEQRFYQGIFTVDESGVRRVIGMYDYGVWDPNACGKDDEYIGDKTLLPGYIHSITTTQNYVILPITSLLINPCKFKEPPLSKDARASLQKGGLWGMDFYDMVPMRFLIFDKNTKQWITQKPFEVFPSMFVTHQLNAYEDTNGNLVADMVVYDSHDPYVKYFYTDFLTSRIYPSTARVLRFTIDIESNRVMYSYLIPQETIAADFSQINHNFDEKPYKWAYLVEHPFASDNTIIKVNVEDPSGVNNKQFKTDPTLVLHEPWFVARPDARKEDDGVLLIKALDTAENKGVLLVVDALTMTEIGRAYVPISVPFGFHNRFFSKKELGLPEGLAGIYGASEIKNKFFKTTTPKPTTENGFWSRLVASTRAPTVPTKWVPISAKPVERLGPESPYPTYPGPIPSSILPAVVGRPSSITQPEDIRMVTMRPPGTIATRPVPYVPPSKTASPVRQLYEHTLKAFCHWLSKIFKTVVFEHCVEGGNKAIRGYLDVHKRQRAV
ncbi:unnamed protein product [Bursaphelenchus xylophilus]|uniref:(pine wood nematode) hypothetical protein n=1 Tax=Bursaphelenchus xylophilus TaxID=6326 RepID=A0A1I7SQP0_BURXY|nr:unnamed protein product [Bursaphelenchus xylophilus]CAG9110178.1 unnamed protein product [Bursaphelenchus xylophilus]